ncbi:MAG: large conductance mechanosensitive channel protein MscL [Candidatus Saccharimonadales bacterium]
MKDEFKKFILRGNVVDLAVAVIIGAAFNAVVQSLVRDFITPLITGATGKKGALVKGQLTIAHRFIFNWGDFVSSILSFIIIAVVIFFLLVHPVNKLIAYTNRHKPKVAGTKKCPECLSDIPEDAKRCAYCTVKLKTD